MTTDMLTGECEHGEYADECGWCECERLNKELTDRIAAAVAEERELCALEAWNNEPDGRIAALIRARGTR